MKLPEWLNELGYGNPCYETTNSVSSIVGGGLYLLPKTEIPNPPKNNSEETFRELVYLFELQEEEREFMEALIKKADKDLLSFFLEKCAEYQIDPYLEKVTELKNLWGAVTGEVKLKFNRPRPFQLATYYEMPLYPMPSVSAWSASYPSGHTVQAEALSRFYSDRYPELADEFKAIAKGISHTRLVGGFHYPSDILAAEELVEELWDDLYSL